jgi:hypothetical protein
VTGDVLRRAAELAAGWVGTLPERPVRAAGEADGLRGPLPEQGEDAVAVIEALAAAAEPGVAILNDVVLNQALVRFGDDDAATEDVIARVQREGTCWLGGTVWHGMAAMRVSVSGWQTTAADADRSADAIAAAWRGQ